MDSLSLISSAFVPTALEPPFSQITTAPRLTHQRDLLRRAASVDSATCGWVNGDKGERFFVSAIPRLQVQQMVIDPPH